MDKKYEYLKALNNVWHEIKLEKENIAGGNSLWTLDVLRDVIQPELKELLKYASNGEVYFKYGNNHRKLESTYLLEGLEPLMRTGLGQSILALQEVYNNI